jgi:hypothetical protein
MPVLTFAADPNATLLSVIAASLVCLAIISTRIQSRKSANDKKMASTLAYAIREHLV